MFVLFWVFCSMSILEDKASKQYKEIYSYVKLVKGSLLPFPISKNLVLLKANHFIGLHQLQNQKFKRKHCILTFILMLHT